MSMIGQLKKLFKMYADSSPEFHRLQQVDW